MKSRDDSFFSIAGLALLVSCAGGAFGLFSGCDGHPASADTAIFSGSQEQMDAKFLDTKEKLDALFSEYGIKNELPDVLPSGMKREKIQRERREPLLSHYEPGDTKFRADQLVDFTVDRERLRSIHNSWGINHAGTYPVVPQPRLSEAQAQALAGKVVDLLSPKDIGERTVWHCDFSSIGTDNDGNHSCPYWSVSFSQKISGVQLWREGHYISVTERNGLQLYSDSMLSLRVNRPPEQAATIQDPDAFARTAYQQKESFLKQKFSESRAKLNFSHYTKNGVYFDKPELQYINKQQLLGFSSLSQFDRHTAILSWRISVCFDFVHFNTKETGTLVDLWFDASTLEPLGFTMGTLGLL